MVTSPEPVLAIVELNEEQALSLELEHWRKSVIQSSTRLNICIALTPLEYCHVQKPDNLCLVQTL